MCSEPNESSTSSMFSSIILTLYLLLVLKMIQYMTLHHSKVAMKVKQIVVTTEFLLLANDDSLLNCADRSRSGYCGCGGGGGDGSGYCGCGGGGGDGSGYCGCGGGGGDGSGYCGCGGGGGEDSGSRGSDGRVKCGSSMLGVTNVSQRHSNGCPNFL